VFPSDGNAHTPTGATSTSEPNSASDIEAPYTNAPDRDVLDD